MTGERAFRYRCGHCAMVVLVVGPRLTDDALRTLGDHVRQLHPRVALRADADAGVILAHFDLAP